MTEIEQRIIELRYEGNTYEEISAAVNKQHSGDTLRHWFEVGGKLYDAYQAYTSERTRVIEQEARKILKKKAGKAAQAIADVLDRVSDGKQDISKKDELILTAAQVVLDRAGIVVIRKLDYHGEEGGELSEEEYVKRCKELGVDPDKLVHADKTEETGEE